jgi:hypothetical protein
MEVARRYLGNGITVEQHLALDWIDQPADHARGGALARAGLADEAALSAVELGGHANALGTR